MKDFILALVLLNYWTSSYALEQVVDYLSLQRQDVVQIEKKYLPGPQEFEAAQAWLYYYDSVNNDPQAKRPAEFKRYRQSLEKSTLFTPFLFFVQGIEQIEDGRDLDKWESLCALTPAAKVTGEQFGQVVIGRLQQFCAREFLIRLQAIGKDKKLLNAKETKLFAKMLPILLRSELRSQFFAWMDGLPKTATNQKKKTQNEPLYLQISQLVMSAMKESRQVESGLLKRIKIDQKLTEFIQSNQLLQAQSSAALTHHLEEMYKKLLKELGSLPGAGAIQARVSALMSYYLAYKEQIQPSVAGNIFLVIARALVNRNYVKLAEPPLQIAYTLTEGEDARETQFYMLWCKILQGQLDQARQQAELMKLNDKSAVLDSRLAYWLAVINFSKKKSSSEQLFKRVIDDYPLSFYAVYATQILRDYFGYDHDYLLQKISKIKDENLFASQKIDPQLEQRLKRILIWKKLNREKIYLRELNDFANYLVAHKKDDLDGVAVAVAVIAKYVAQDQAFIQSFKFLITIFDNKVLFPGHQLLAIMFPFAYVDLIRTQSRSDVDPLVILSLIRQESAFNPMATSRVGARGLMQLMPRTAATINRRIRTHHLRDSETNIRLGVEHFRSVSGRLDGNLIHILSAYNAGESKVKYWKKQLWSEVSFPNILYEIENIPYNETKNYVKLIFRNIYFYNYLLSLHEKRAPQTRPIFKIRLD